MAAKAHPLLQPQPGRDLPVASFLRAVAGDIRSRNADGDGRGSIGPALLHGILTTVSLHEFDPWRSNVHMPQRGLVLILAHKKPG